MWRIDKWYAMWYTVHKFSKRTIMPTMTVTEARKNRFGLVDEVADEHRGYCIVGKRNQAVLLSMEDWSAIQESLAVALSSAAFFAPFDILQPCVGSIIVAISRYTMGIYFIHILVGRPLQNFVFAHTGLVQQSFLGSIAIFAVCWTVCWIVSLIPSKWARSLVE